MKRLYTEEQVFRMLRRKVRKYEIKDKEHATDVFFALMDDTLLNHVFLDILDDLYDTNFISPETHEEVSDMLYMYYGDIITKFIDKEF